MTITIIICICEICGYYKRICPVEIILTYWRYQMTY